MHGPLATLSLLLVACAAPPAAGQSNQAPLDRHVAAILVERCLECHSGADPEAGLILTSGKAARAGGDSGPALSNDKPSESLLWERIEADEMPPKTPLTAEEKEIVRKWLASGAAWGGEPLDRYAVTTKHRAGRDWWALQPLADPTPPETIAADWVRNPIDRFVAAKLHAQGLEPSEEADRRTLIRRLTYDLHGLPPTPGEVEAFVADDRPDAYDRLVTRLLDSPHYGIRWGRHWLDVARFGESQGFERDKLRENSWPYRDWVIDALNRDMPYQEFVRQQIAGDVLPGDSHSIVATGFLVAGPYDEVGQKQQSAAMRAVVRQDELEDIVSLVGQTFLGLTVNCARCHDHKFDPITQREYYAMTAALAGVRHGSRNVAIEVDPQQTAAINARIEAARNELQQLEDGVRKRIANATDSKPIAKSNAPLPIAQWTFDTDFNDSLGELHGKANGKARIEGEALRVDGNAAFVATAPLANDIAAKTLEAWVRLDNLSQRGGAAISIQSLDGATFDAIVFGEREPGRWMAGSNFFARTQPFGGSVETEASERPVHLAIVYSVDGTITAYREGQPYGKPYQSPGLVAYKAGAAQLLFGLRHGPPGGNRMLAGAIDAARLYDRALSAEEIAQSYAAGGNGSAAKLLAAMTSAEKEQRTTLRKQIAELSASLPQAKSMSVYACTPRAPGVTHLLLRGNPAAKGEPVAAAGLAAVSGVEADFGLAADASDAERRRMLAEWITDRDNPLLARVIVNRLWHHHFGAGLVETPNDFGFNGGRPSHPELIDYLARQLWQVDGSLKQVHRLIVSSAAYRQSSRYRESAAAIDADNRLLWRREAVRLDAEALRDSMLMVAGQLNEKMGGPGYRDFTTHTHNSQFYEIEDRVGAEFQRRTIYRTWVRSGRNPLLDVFDCPDPSTKTPRRAVTTTPLQALAMLNNSFVLRMSERLADRIRATAADDPAAQVRQAFRLAYQREVSDEQAKRLAEFVSVHGLPELCRVIFNSNEFLYVD